jgi:ABC-type glycerol-3-phosphate transport system permease component
MMMKRKAAFGKIKSSKVDRIYSVFIYVFLALVTIVILYPLIYVVSCSFSSAEALVGGQVFFLPVDVSLLGFKAVFHNNEVWMGYLNTFLYTAVGTLIGTCVTLLGSYVLSRQEFQFRKILTTLFMITMIFSGGLLPTYIVVNGLGLYNSIWAIVLPGAFSVWLAIIGRTFIKSTIPEELFEATCLDGGDYIQYLLCVVLPLSKPIIAVLALNFAVGHWNSYFSALVYLKDTAKFPLQIILRNIIIANIFDAQSIGTLDIQSLIERKYIGELLKYSLIIVSSVPMLIIYPMLQKYFIKCVMIGSLKG